MRTPGSGLYADNPAWPLLQALISYWGPTSADGNALGTTLVCADLDNHPTYVGNRVKVIIGGAWGQDRLITAHAAGGVLTLDAAYTNAAGAPQQILAGTLFVILSNPGGGGGGGGGMPPTAPLWMFGIVSPAQVASTTVIDIPHLAGFQDDTFNDEFYMQVLNAGGAAPEGEKRIITDYDGGTGRFTTDAFSANVEAGDIVAIYHTAIEAIDIVARGTFTLSDLVQPEDNTRAESNNAFRGCLLMPTEGAAAFQPRLITSYTGAGGVFDLDPGNPFADLPGLVDYVILKHQEQFVPLVNGVQNRLPADVIGNKQDAARYTSDNFSSLLAYLKGLVNAGIAISGAVADVGPAITDFDTDLAEATDDHYNGMLLMFTTGPNAGQAHVINDYAAGTRNVSFLAGDQWTDVPVNGNAFVILPDSAQFIRALITAIGGGFQEQADVAVNINAILAAETDVLNLAAANTRYIVRSLRLKCADPGANTVTVRLYELVNDGLTQVDSFAVTAATFATYHSLMDMFGVPHLAGDRLQVTVQASAGGPYAVTGQYSHATAT